MAVINGIFDAVRYTLPKTSDFDAKHDVKTACKVGEVIPFDCIPTYGGDSWHNITYAKQAKFNALVAPAFQRMVLKSWSFYVRNSDLWDDFDEFFTGVNPRNGRTAYNSNTAPLVHPYLKADKFTQCGTGYLGARLNLIGVDISRVQIDGDKVYIPRDVLKSCIDQVGGVTDNKDAVSYVYGDKEIKSLFSMYLGYDTFFKFGNQSRIDIDLGTEDSEKAVITFTDSADDPSNTDSVHLLPEMIYNGMKYRGLRPVFSPSSICDRLGYPCADWKTYVFTQDFLDQIKNLPEDSRAYDFAHKYIFKDKQLNAIFTTDFPFTYSDQQNDLLNVYPYGTTMPAITEGKFTFTGPIAGGGHASGSWNLVMVAPNFNAPVGATTLGEIVCRYIVWCKLHNVTTTMLDDAPCFDVCELSEFLETSEFEVDSLRIRAYHKLWNDYYREPSLTAEIPIPFSDGGDDFENYFNAVLNYLSTNSDSENMYDWRRENLYKSSRYKIFPYLASNYYNKSGLYSSTVATQILIMAVWNDLLVEPFRHVRVRDYLTGALPNTGIVDVVAPIMGQDLAGMYPNGLPYTNNPVSYSDADGLKVDNTEINPVPANLPGRESPVGWLDIENLHITQKLKEYFLTLRHAMNGIKDYMKVFFNVDIDNQTIKRARFLRGDEQYVNISEVVSSAETTSQPLGSIAGRATSYGEDGGLSFDVKECGFLLTLVSLSPVTTNVGGLDRSLIRHTRFDYFNPKFAELGDMSVTKKEVSLMPMLKGSDIAFYDKTFGYTQRYMDCKYIPSQVHADFLGAMSDWHLDQIQPAIASDDAISLSQNWLEEREDDRIFAEVNDDANTCYIWAECRGSFTRALPAIEREVIA